MAEQWFYEKEGHQYGPLSPQQMRSLGQSGKLAPDDLVWREGMQTKIAASQYKGLLPFDSAVLSDANESGVVHLKTENHRRSSKVSSRKLTIGEIFQHRLAGTKHRFY